MDGVLKIIKSDLKIKTGYSKADEANDYVWLLETLEDIMIRHQGGIWGFLGEIQNHVTIRWDFLKDVGHLLKYMENPTIPEPTDMTEAK